MKSNVIGRWSWRRLFMSRTGHCWRCNKCKNLFKRSWPDSIKIMFRRDPCAICKNNSFSFEKFELWTTIGGISYEQQQVIFRKAAELKKRGLTTTTIADVLGEAPTKK